MLIVEVLSSGTENYDKGAKFEKYQSIPSFKEYVLVRQDKAEVTTYHREEPDLWKTVNITDLKEQVVLRSVAAGLDTSRIYKGIVF